MACSFHSISLYKCVFKKVSRGGSRTAAASRIECFVIIVNGSQSAPSWILQQS